ncbi:MAG TPA: hypothetical protein VGC13_26765 [Longimicrobium sp.]|jgi:hypothetical protein|uniref:hypothetical protein n=1 Tax=Longimicrobium sp. TaxID=2029185 RepID=UPI002ED7C746
MTYVAIIIAAVLGIIGVALPTQPHEAKRSGIRRIRPGGWLVIVLMIGSLTIGVKSQTAKDQQEKKQRTEDSVQYATTIKELTEQRWRDSLKLLQDSTWSGLMLANLQLQLTNQDSLLSRTASQLQRQSENLQMLRRSLTRFDRLGFRMVFTYPLADPFYDRYVGQVRHQAQQALTDYVIANSRRPVRADGSVAYVNYDTIWSVFGRWDAGGDSAIVDSVDIGPEAPLALHADPLKRVELQDVLGQALVHLAFYRNDQTLKTPDLRLRVAAWNPVTREKSVGTHSLDRADPAAIRLQINFRRGRIEQTLYSSEYERSDGGLGNEIVSIEDLVGSTVVISREELRLNGSLVGEHARMAAFEILWGPDRSNRIILHACRLGWQPTRDGFRRVVYRFEGNEPGLRSSPSPSSRTACPAA